MRRILCFAFGVGVWLSLSGCSSAGVEPAYIPTPLQLTETLISRTRTPLPIKIGVELFAPPSERLVTQKTIGNLLWQGVIPESIVVSADSRSIAGVANVGEDFAVLVNDLVGEPYPGIKVGTPIFSPDSQRVAYIVAEVIGEYVVIDGREGKRYDEIMGDSLLFSPDSSRIAYMAIQGQKERVVIDGDELPRYDVITRGTIAFSPNSQRLAYAASDLLRFSLGQPSGLAVVDGEKGKLYEGVGPSAYCLSQPAEEGDERERICADGPIFSPNSERVAYTAYRTPSMFVVVDAEEGSPYGTTLNITFSPDSSRLAYVASTFIGGDEMVVIDGVEQKQYKEIDESSVIFSPDSEHLAFIAETRTLQLVVVDGEGSKAYDLIGEGSLLFSPDSQHVAFAAVQGPSEFTVIDGEEQEHYGVVISNTLSFSPDSSHIAYGITASSGKDYAIVDGQKIGPYDFLVEAPIVFSPDSLNFAFAAMIGERMTVVVNGEIGELYDAVLEGVYGAKVIFDAPTHLHYFAISGDDLILVDEDLE